MKKLYKVSAVLLITMFMSPWMALANDTEATESGDGGEAEAEETAGAEKECETAGGSTYSAGDSDGCQISAKNASGVYFLEGDTMIYACSFGPESGSASAIEYPAMDEDMDLNEETALIEAVTSEFEEAYAATLTGTATGGAANGRCGEEVNPATGYLEQGDCAADGLIVTEIAEAFAGNTSIGDEAKVTTVYKGVCCMILEDQGDGTYECKDQRTIYFTSSDNCNGGSMECSRRQWIIGDSGASIIKVYVKQIYIWAAGTIGFIAVVTIVLNGIRISVSGVSGDITQAKERIIQAISGLVLLFMSGLILYTINPTFFS